MWGLLVNLLKEKLERGEELQLSEFWVSDERGEVLRADFS